MKSLKDLAHTQVKLPSLKGKRPSLKGKGPSLKRSSAKSPTPKPPRKRPTLKGPQVKAPKFVTDVGQDLRDRHLLLPALALLVALVAVPVLLSTSGSEAPPPTAVAAGDEATAVESAVLTEQVGIRNYRKRLAALKQKNPFEQKFALPEPSTEGATGAGAAAATAATADSSGTTSSTGTPSSGGGGTSISETFDTTAVNETNEATIDETAPEQPPKPEIRFYAGRIDVAVGPIGKTKTYEGVRYLDFLPDDKRPVVAFLGLGEGGEKAVFSVSSDVTETDGEGSCAPKAPAPCQFLTLRIGEQRMLKLADGETYRLKLLDTHVVRIPDPRNEGKGSDQPSDEAPIAGKR